MGTKILTSLDIASSVTGLASGTIGVASAVLGGAALTMVAPVAVAGGIIAGGYSVVRSGMTIHDKVVREEVNNLVQSKSDVRM